MMSRISPQLMSRVTPKFFNLCLMQRPLVRQGSSEAGVSPVGYSITNRAAVRQPCSHLCEPTPHPPASL
jgi:hypothetical protein